MRGRTGWRLAGGLAVLAMGLLVFMFLSARADPVVRTLRYDAPSWPKSAPPMRLVLLTDVHAAPLITPPARLGRIVDQINRQHPDIVLIGGDFLGRDMSRNGDAAIAQALAPLRALRASRGVIAVMGNHDQGHEARAIRASLLRSGVTILDNSAMREGPLAIGGVNDAQTGRADLTATVAAMDRLGGTPVLLTHSPDVFPRTPPRIGLVLAGHTHCGQISPPLIGPVVVPSRYGRRYACGVIANGGQRLVVSAGIGTTALPLRLNAPPDIWVIDVGS